MSPNSPEKAPLAPHTKENGGIVIQPHRVEALLAVLEDASEKVSEQVSARAGEQSAGSGLVTSTAQQQAKGQSWRDQAIAAIPAPQIMQQQLEEHIRTEVKKLRLQADHVTRLASPGAAYEAAKLWSRIRRLNALLSEVLHAAEDALKRLFIKVFIDRQPIL